MPDDSRLSLNEIKAVGEEHNHYVLEGFQNFDFLARDKEQALIMSFLEFSPNLRSEELSLILNLGEKGFDPKLNGKTFQNRLTLELYNQLVALSNQEIEHYSVFEKDVNNIKSRVMDNLKGMDREFMLISIEVALNSANLWLLTNQQRRSGTLR